MENYGGGTENLRGCFTIQRYIQGKSLREIERLLGFNEGRLAKGARFYTPVVIPGINNFEFAGYTQVSTDRIKEVYGDINKRDTEIKKIEHDEQKRRVAGNWRVYGAERLIKVAPVISTGEYPPGAGVPQWKFIHPITCRLVSFVREWDGRFIPDQGYVEVKYK